MIILDTDHVSIFAFKDHPRYASLMDRLDRANDVVSISIVTWEEQVRGWLMEIRRSKHFHEQVFPYEKLSSLIEFFSKWQILPFTTAAAARCQSLRRERVRIGSQDLKIAAIALADDALLLSANLADFRKVPGLRVENWLD
jgi:tRNA(fMet)-specific endonuclease VapC